MASPRARFIRNTQSGPLLDTFLVFSVGSVLVTRAYLAATGYPQVGNGTFHIAHVLWGGLLMLVAIVLALATINAGARRVLAALGGIGFGLFIDEVGKFITKNVDYFYKPAIAIIYVCFVGMFFLFRYLERDSRMTPTAALTNAFVLLSESAHRTLTASDRARVEYLVSRASDLPLADEARSLLADIPTTEAKPSRFGALLAVLFLRPYRWFARSRLFIWIMAINALLSFLTVIALATDVFLLIPESTRSAARRTLEDGPGTSATAICILIGSAAFGIMMGIGLWKLRRSRLRALVWFDRAYLFSILVIQVFLFAESQLAAIAGLIVDLFIWGAIRIALGTERVKAERAAFEHQQHMTEIEPDRAAQ